MRAGDLVRCDLGRTHVLRLRQGTADLMRLAIAHRGFAFLNVMSPCVTWRGDEQFKVLRAKARALSADHDRSSTEAALRFTNETEHLTTGVLFETRRPTLVEEMLEIREARASQRSTSGSPIPSRRVCMRIGCGGRTRISDQRINNTVRHPVSGHFVREQSRHDRIAKPIARRYPRHAPTARPRRDSRRAQPKVEISPRQVGRSLRVTWRR
jgi:hypothetical protein